MTSVAAVRVALAGQLQAGTSLMWLARWPGLPNPPVGVVQRRSIAFGIEFNGGGPTTFAATVYLPSTSYEEAQDALDVLLSPRTVSGSIAAAVHADPSLGGVVRSAIPTGAEEDGLVSFDGGGGASYWSGSVSIVVTHT